ncbi:TPR repeat-containing protein slr0751 [Durusdinium trenchii]|uniref:TPR repeat-containing protein slr0751 n=1 Tax=Durusdinium trenchii TaxID=1381693 RepID=A0ABP0MZ47_9DINO
MSAAGPEGVALEITESSLTFYPGLAAALPHERAASQRPTVVPGALANFHLGLYDVALEDYDRALRLEHSAVAFYNRALVEARRGKYESAVWTARDLVGTSDSKAVRDYGRAIELDPNAGIAFHGRASAKLLGTKDAIDDYDRALQLDPSSARAFYDRASAKFRLGALGWKGRGFGSWAGKTEVQPGATGLGRVLFHLVPHPEPKELC